MVIFEIVINCYASNLKSLVCKVLHIRYCKNYGLPTYIDYNLSSYSDKSGKNGESQ